MATLVQIPSSFSTGGVIAGVLLGADGTAALPSYSFEQDPDTGVYRISANRLGLSAGGVLQLDIQGGIAAFAGQVNAQTYVQTGLSNVAGNAALIFGSAATSMRVHKHASALSTFYTIDGNATTPGFLNTGVFTSPKTANYTLVLGDLGTHFTTTGAAGSVQFTLPTPMLGYFARFTATAAQVMTVVTPSGAIFAPGSLSGTTRTVTATTAAAQYTSFDVVCYDGTNYVVRGLTGTMT